MLVNFAILIEMNNIKSAQRKIYCLTSFIVKIWLAWQEDHLQVNISSKDEY